LDQRVPLHRLLWRPPAAELEERLADCRDVLAVARVLEDTLISRQSAAAPIDEVVARVIVDLSGEQAGYADQPHLTRECQRLAGATPLVLAHTEQLNLSANGCN
jgi:hypothetical protein